MKFAYADPPYLGQGKKKYEHPEWDKKETHIALVMRLILEYPDGWVLSCNPRDLRWLLPVCPEDARTAPWVKSFHRIRSVTVQYAHEEVIFCGGRADPGRKPMVRDWLMANATRKRGVIGAKPPEFNRWVLDLLNFKPGEDTIDELFPGTGGLTDMVKQMTLPNPHEEQADDTLMHEGRR